MLKIKVDVTMVYEDGEEIPSMRREYPVPDGGKVEVAIRSWMKGGDYAGGAVEEFPGAADAGSPAEGRARRGEVIDVAPFDLTLSAQG